MAETKKCEHCDAEIGATETSCPKCGVNFEELEEVISTLDKANKVLEKRRKAAQPPEPPAPPAPAKKKTGISLFRSLGGKK